MECEHEYEVLQDGIQVDELRFGDGDVDINVSGYIIFHCKKCLDIQKRVL